jgi:hypothetical protein
MLRVCGEEVGELCAAARFLHHGAHGVAPFCIVRSFFMRFGGRFVAIDLHQHEPGRIIRLLHDIKSSDSGLSNAIPRILNRRFNKISHGFGIHVDLDMDDKHKKFAGVSCQWIGVASVSRQRGASMGSSIGAGQNNRALSNEGQNLKHLDRIVEFPNWQLTPGTDNFPWH